MARKDSGAQRVDYGNKTGELGRDKEVSTKDTDMIRGGASGGDGGSGGPTGSSRDYPKSSKVDLTPDFNPMKDRKHSGTDWAVGGV